MMTIDNLDTGFMNYESNDLSIGEIPKEIELYGYFVYAGANKEVVGQHVTTRYRIILPEPKNPDKHEIEMYFAFPAQDEFLFCQFQFNRI